MKTQSFQFSRCAVWAVALAILLGPISTAEAADGALAIRARDAKVLEVSGAYAKIARADQTVEVGDAAELVRDGAAGDGDVLGVVTAVQAEYVVVKFDAVKPRPGDAVRFHSGAAAGEEGEAEETASHESRPERKSGRERLQERRARLEEERRQKEEENRQKWLARLAVRGIEPWEEATDEEHDAALERYKRMGREVQELLPGVQLYETTYFLFYTNIPPGQVAPYVRYLDAMYVMMARLFGIPDDHDVWLGRKAPVFAFLTQEQFLAFERRYFQNLPVGAYGICHQSARGDVVIACYRGEDPHDFGQMLVHETSHGFVFRYKTKANLPVWVDEGMAEYIGEKMVPASDSVRNKERAALAQLKQTRSFGASFFEKEANLAAWQYGVASSLNKFLITSGQDRYVAFIEGMKEGMEWHEALQHAYGASPAELVVLYGRALGVPALGL